MKTKVFPIIGAAFLLCGLAGDKLCYANDDFLEKGNKNEMSEYVRDSMDEVIVADEEQIDIIEEQTEKGESSMGSVQDSTSEGSKIIMSKDKTKDNCFDIGITLVQEENPYDFFNTYSYAILLNDYATMMGASLDAITSQDAYEAWQSYETYLAGYEIYADDEHALYSIILTFTNSGQLGFPEMSGDYDPGIIRYLYVTKKDGYWYADGPLHKELPSDEWWSGEQYTWKAEDYGFSDSTGEGKTILTQEDMDTFNAEIKEYTERLFGCEPSVMKYCI